MTSAQDTYATNKSFAELGVAAELCDGPDEPGITPPSRSKP